jgi:hypothetical protein
MQTRYLLAATLAAGFMSSTALAQTTTPAAKAPAPVATTADVAPKLASPHWRASKLVGVKVYNEQNERLGDINEIILDQTGKTLGYVIGVGGFLGMGEHDIFVEPSKIKFVNEPLKSASSAPANNPPAAPNAGAPSNTRNVSGTTATKNRATDWYPDHGILSANKDQLKAMPQFKYSNYN